MKNWVSGACLCGAVTVKFSLEVDSYGACHCGMCRKWGGGPGMAVDAGTEVEFEGEEFVSTYGSSEWAERGFCRRCGTHLFHRLKASGFYNIPVGLLDGVEHLELRREIFVDQKPEGYSFANKTQKMTEAEVFAKHCAE